MDTKTILVISGIAVPFFLLTCWAMISVAGRDFGSLPKKAMWGLISFIPFIGAVVYILFGMKQGKKMEISQTQ